nr:hypothetical protein [Tanacetum cinerariifolium]
MRFLLIDPIVSILTDYFSFTITACRSRKRCRSPTTSVPSTIFALGALSPTRADLLPPRKRFRSSSVALSLEASIEGSMEIGSEEEDIDSDVMADIEADIAAAAEIVEPVVPYDISVSITDEGSREDFEIGLDVVIQELFDHMLEIPYARGGNMRLRGGLAEEREWADSIRRRLSNVQEELRQIDSKSKNGDDNENGNGGGRRNGSRGRGDGGNGNGGRNENNRNNNGYGDHDGNAGGAGLAAQHAPSAPATSPFYILLNLLRHPDILLPVFHFRDHHHWIHMSYFSFTIIACRSRKRCRSPTTSVPSTILALGALSPTRADLFPPRKRFRSSSVALSLEASIEGSMEIGSEEEDIDSDVMADIEADITAAAEFITEADVGFKGDDEA